MASQFAHGIRPFDIRNCDEVVWLLGSRFEGGHGELTPEQAAYIKMFHAIKWLTYRRDFAPMDPYDYTSDSGWGCMLRTGQMILAQALQRHLFNQNIRSAKGGASILRWFADVPRVEAIYSIHNMVQVGLQYDKLPGEWYGPTTAAQVLRDLVHLHAEKLGGTMEMLVPQEGVIYLDVVEGLCSSSPSNSNSDEPKEAGTPSTALYDPLLNPPPAAPESKWSKALFILIPLRLGLDHINGDYLPAIIEFFKFPQSTGIIGGKRGHSVYFVGVHGSELHLLDPHTTQPALQVSGSAISSDLLATTSCGTPLVMSMENVDPSLAIGFYIKDRLDFQDFCGRVQGVSQHCLCPFSIASSTPDYSSEVDMVNEAVSAGESDEEDEYVLIESH